MTVDKGKGERIVVRDAIYYGGMCPRCEGMGSITDMDLTQLYDDTKSLREGALKVPGYSMDGWYGRIFAGAGFDMDKPIRDYTPKELDRLLHKEPTKIKVDGVNLTFEGLIPRIQKSMLSKDVDTLQPHVRAFVERAVTFTAVPRVRRHPAQRAGPIVEDRRDQHRRGLRDADRRPRRVAARPGRAVGRAAARRPPAHVRLVRRDRARLPLARPAVGHAVGRRVPAHPDDPPPRLVADRRHLRLRRAHDRAASARHRPDERPAAAAARQGQHGARRRAQARGHRHRRPRRRPRPGRRDRRRRGGLRGHGRGAAGQRHADRATPRRPRLGEAVGADADGPARGARRQHQQPPGRRCRHPARRAGRADRRGRVGQELADRRLGRGPGRRGVDRPGRDQGLAAQQPGDLHRAARPDPQRRSRRPTA